jgi:hypothetical protein
MFLPTLCNGKNTGPLESNLIKRPIIGKKGIRIMSPIEESSISISLLAENIAD